MAKVPESVADFLRGKRIAVAGVSRGTTSAANPVYRKLRDGGYEVFPVNPNAAQVEGVTCYPGLASVSEAAVRECEEHAIPCIVGGCPLMYCQPVDFGHRCMRAWLGWRRRL